MTDHAASLSADDRLDVRDVERRIKAIFIGSVGNLVEWYDFYAYTAFALYFAPAFFPNSDPVVQQLNAAVLFAATFLMRPLGGWLFGYIADRHGRRLSLTLSVVCMCFGSLIIAVTPTYASIGMAAPAILAIARVIEGLSLGGEYGASATYLSEVADAKHRGFYSSFQYVTLIGGQLTAIIVLLLLQKVFLTPQELQDWGWRIPFVIGAVLAVFAAVMRRNLHETEAFEEASKIARPTGSITGLLNYPRELLLVVGLTAGGTAAFYTFTTYMQTFVKLSVGLTADQTTLVIFGTLVFATLLQPIYGAISDKIGRKPVLIFFGAAGTLATIPILTTLKETKSPLMAFLLICAAWIFVAGYTSINAIVKAELFPTKVRALGVGLPYAITVSVFGGTAPAVALYFKSLGHEDWFYYYLSGMIFLSLIIYTTMRDTKHEFGDASSRVAEQLSFRRSTMPTERFQFTGSEGHQLAAALDTPEGEIRAYALFAHCFTCGKDVLAAKRIAVALAAKGIAVLRFDFTGLGSSEGDFANSTFASNVADLVRAADHLRETRKAPAILIGHSLGGAAILAAAVQIPDARAVVTIAAPSDPAHVTGLFADRIEDIHALGKAEVSLAGRPFTVTRQLLEDIAEHGLMAQVAKLHKALLVMHSPTDDTVGIDNATRIFVAARHPKSFVSLAGADHLLSDRRDATYVADVIAAWASRYLDPAVSEQGTDPGEAPRNVVVRETRNSKFQQTVTIGPHRLLADEPVTAGGEDAGPGPYDFLLAGLGACTSMTLRLYADRKSLPLERTTVTLSHSKIHARGLRRM